LDNSYYDLLASEARLASFIAIAKNDVPVDHWFRLGRSLTHAAGETALVSWSGSMFEYLMPLLVMQSYPSTLLDQTYEGAVRRHATYCGERDVPWGISESAYNVRDRFQTYQYRAFGVPDLALKRGLSRDLVVAPYASALAVMVDATAALANLHSLERLEALGAYGFRDAIDYTRPDAGHAHAVVCTYMAHHIGMGFVALTNALTGQQWKRRFHADPLVRSVELLLHERIPRRLILQRAQGAHPEEALPDPELERPAVREFETPDTPEPRVALLGHLPYTLMASHCGGGYSRYEGLAVTRWRADGTRDNTGQFCYVRDVSRSRVWSAAHQPVCATADWYRAFLATDRVTFHRRDGDIETRTEIAIVPEDLAEVRRITLTNNSDDPREIELTSYGEIVLAQPDADRAHPAFANLFVETEWHAWASAITATRRPRSAQEQRLWCVHVVATGKESVGVTSCETDRDRFIGRGRSTRDPVAVEREGALSGTTGAVLDPIFALRTRLRIAPGQTATASFTTLVAGSRVRAFELADRYDDSHAAQRAFDLAWTAAQVELRELGVTPADAAVFQDLAGHLFYPDPALRASENELRENHGAQTLLWSQGISGDWPILLATIESADGLPTVRQLLVAHQYLRRRGMMVDLVLINEHPPTYLEALSEQITAVLLASSEAGVIDRPGGVFVRRGDFLSKEELLMLRATARVLVECDGRALGRILGDDAAGVSRDAAAPRRDAVRLLTGNGRRNAVLSGSRRRETGANSPWEDAERERGSVRRDEKGGRKDAEVLEERVARDTESSAIQPSNGLGDLTQDGDYEIRLVGDSTTPAPWANVVSNERGGFVVTERGGGFSWAENSYFYRLTPWHNDPVSDPASEVLYLRDEDTKELWSATPAPIRQASPYTIRHGAGWSSFQHEHSGITTNLTLGVPRVDSVKISVLRVTNSGTTRRRLSVTAYAEWALGALREHTQHQVRTAFDGERNTVFAQNFFDPQFAHLVAFCALSEPVTSYTADRREFLGRNGSAGDPAAFRGRGMTRTTGAGIDPCAALQCVLELAPGETRDVVVLLGAAAGDADARKMIARYGNAISARQALEDTREAWVARLSIIAVQTPDSTFDAMLNRWTLYQALACRMWARSALYQSSGAYGFRDQLQDIMAFVYAEPAIAREHILRSAARQFVEGDVQHWWHPQSGRGVRTRFSDDLVWLPYVVDHYVRVTGDTAVLDESAPFLEMRALEPNEHEVYDLPQLSAQHGSVYDHCLLALRKACTTGVHGLPLIGGGDWNDGMNRVGAGGQGESVWLAWFLITTLRAFAEHVERRGDSGTAEEFRRQALAYSTAAEEHGWDGKWYRRAYYDDGTPIGSAENDECKIDSLAQSWSVISGAADPERQAQAMRSMNEHLVREDARLVALLTPAFNNTPHDPGYIKGYVPGVRENGAQYTHAALWAALGTAMLGDGDRA
ncbi:MAG: GH36-type glycosyl hydrolase domain-containing protein, partial [Gemmatimonadaceae bacterium]